MEKGEIFPKAFFAKTPCKTVKNQWEKKKKPMLPPKLNGRCGPAAEKKISVEKLKKIAPAKKENLDESCFLV